MVKLLSLPCSQQHEMIGRNSDVLRRCCYPVATLLAYGQIAVTARSPTTTVIRRAWLGAATLVCECVRVCNVLARLVCVEGWN